MELIELSVFDLANATLLPLADEKRQAIERSIASNVAEFGKETRFQWGRRSNEEFVRATIDPFILELVFVDRTATLFGTAPAWAQLLFTKARQEQLIVTAEKVLNDTGFVAVRRPPQKVEARGWAARRRAKSQS